MFVQAGKKEALHLWQQVTSSCVRMKSYDLSMRQLAVLLSVYLEPAPHTVKNLAERMNISKPAICRALDYLARSGLLKRMRDEHDRRNVLIQRTVKGSVFLTEFSELIMYNLGKV